MKALQGILIALIVSVGGLLASFSLFVSWLSFIVLDNGYRESLVISLVVLLLLFPLYSPLLSRLVNLSYKSKIVAIFFDSITVSLTLIFLYFLDYFVIGYLYKNKKLVFSYSSDVAYGLPFFVLASFTLYYLISLLRAYVAYKKTESLNQVICILLSPMISLIVVIGGFYILIFITLAFWFLY